MCSPTRPARLTMAPNCTPPTCWSAPTPRSRRTEVVRIIPNEDAIVQHVEEILLEQNDERAVQRGRYMTLETIAPLSDDPPSASWQSPATDGNAGGRGDPPPATPLSGTQSVGRSPQNRVDALRHYLVSKQSMIHAGDSRILRTRQKAARGCRLEAIQVQRHERAKLNPTERDRSLPSQCPGTNEELRELVCDRQLLSDQARRSQWQLEYQKEGFQI
jgi:hypothetical protein